MPDPIIRLYDFETSDMEPPKAKVIEVGFTDLIQVGGEWLIGETVSWLCGGVKTIAPGARAANHIDPGDLWRLAPYDAAGMWAEAKEHGVIVAAAHNAEFEAGFWGEAPIPVLCTYKAALRVWPEAPSHSNGALRYFLQDQGLIAPDHELTMPPHRAGPDSYVTAWLLSELLKHATAREMVGWTREPRLLPKCPIGKFRGKPWAAVEGGFLEWMLKQSDMDADLVWNARRELARRAAPPPSEPEPEAEAI